MVTFPPITYKEIIRDYPELEKEINELAKSKNESLNIIILSCVITFTALGYFIRGFFL